MMMMMKRVAPRSTLRKIIKKQKPQLRLAANADLLNSGEAAPHAAIRSENKKIKVHLSFLVFLHRLAEESRTNAFANKSKIIKPEHTIAAAKVILKKSRG